MRCRRVWIVAAAVLLVACSGDDSSTDPTAAPVDETRERATTAAPAGSTEAPATTGAETTTTSTTSTTTTTSTVPEEPATLFAELAGESIVLLTPATGNGPKPLLAWEPVPGATTYDLIVNTADGAPYWAWRGTTPQVWLGGSQTEPSPDTEGPVLTGPMLLTVVATDDSGAPIAAIGPVEIAR